MESSLVRLNAFQKENVAAVWVGWTWFWLVFVPGWIMFDCSWTKLGLVWFTWLESLWCNDNLFDGTGLSWGAIQSENQCDWKWSLRKWI